MKENAPTVEPRPLTTKKPGRGKPRLIRRRPPFPAIRLTPYAWAKLLYLRDAGPTEIGGFGISAPEEPLLIEEVALVPQTCDWASVLMDDGGVADHFDRQVEQGRQPEEFARVWIHTHPGACPRPSATDEETFTRVFGRCQWSVMLIVAVGGASYARLAFGVGPGGGWEIPVEIDFDRPFPAADHAAWQAEYEATVRSRSEEVDWDERWTLTEGAAHELLV